MPDQGFEAQAAAPEQPQQGGPEQGGQDVLMQGIQEMEQLLLEMVGPEGLASILEQALAQATQQQQPQPNPQQDPGQSAQGLLPEAGAPAGGEEFGRAFG